VDGLFTTTRTDVDRKNGLSEKGGRDIKKTKEQKTRQKKAQSTLTRAGSFTTDERDVLMK